MPKEKIKITCRGAATITFESLLEFQGNLKDLSKENYERLKSSILEEGFAAPIAVWQNKKKNHILDGHQRLRVIKELIKQGYDCPPLPVDYIEAKSEKEARRKLARVYESRYGRLNEEGLYEFAQLAEFSPEQLIKDLDLPNFNMSRFIDGYYEKDYPSETKVFEGSKEYSEEDFSKLKHKCPKCGFEFGKEFKEK